MSTPDSSKEIKITNSSGASVALMLPTISSETADANGTLVYDQALEILTAVDGTTKIADGATSTFVLDQTYTDPSTGKPAYSTIYDLLPSTTDWYKPVANIGVMQSLFPPKTYPAQTVTAASAKAFKNAAIFIQTISAYPSSALAKSYAQALTQAQSSASKSADGSSGSSSAVAQSLSGTVNDFFKGTKSFQDVTLQAVVAIQSYYGTFPFAWGQFAAKTITYYLYSSNGSTTSFVGTVSLTPPASLNVALANAGYTCTFTPASNGSDTTKVDVNTASGKSLTYTSGLFVDDVSSDAPQIAVRGTFQIKSLFTQKSTDTQIITVLTGSVNGATCIGFDSPQLSSDPSSTFWDTLFHPKNSAQIFQTVMTLGGALMMLLFFASLIHGVYKWARNLGKEPLTLEQFDARFQMQNKALLDKIDALTKAVTDGKGTAPRNLNDALDSMESDVGDITANEAAARLYDGFNAQAANLEALAEFAPQMTAEQLAKLESIATRVEDGAQALEDADPADYASIVADQAPVLKSVNADFANLMQEVSDFVDENVQATIQSNVDLATQVSQEMDELPKEEENASGDDPIVDETVDVP